MPIDDEGSSEVVAVALVTGNWFSELGVQARFGRALIPEDDADSAGGSMPIVASYSFWQRYFNSDPQALGKTVRLRGRPFQIVGILPEDFNGLRVDSSPMSGFQAGL